MSERYSQLLHLLLQDHVLSFRGGYDSLAGSGSLHAENLLEAMALLFILGLLKLLLAYCFSRRFLFEDLHQLSIELIPPPLNSLLCLSLIEAEATGAARPPRRGRVVQLIPLARLRVLERLGERHGCWH